METKFLTRIAVIVLVAAALTATAVKMSRKGEEPVQAAPAPAQLSVDPLREGQRRCQQLGEAAASDADCLRIWAETRDRFLGRVTSPEPAE